MNAVRILCADVNHFETSLRHYAERKGLRLAYYIFRPIHIYRCNVKKVSCDKLKTLTLFGSNNQHVLVLAQGLHIIYVV
jgi:hypothetical protein